MSLHSFVTSAASIQHHTFEAPSAWLGHIPFGAWLVQATKPNILIELGTHYGHSYFSFCESVKHNKLSTKCYAVDTWRGDVHAGEYGPEVYEFISNYNANHYSNFSSLLRMEFDNAVDNFTDNSIDFLHIDGLHTYDAVRHDFMAWLPKLSERAVVVFHDTNVKRDDFGVWQLWEELSSQYPNIYFEHSYGLGVLFVGREQSNEIQALLKEWANAEERKTIQLFFFKLGRCVQNDWEIAHLKTNWNNVDQEANKKMQAISEKKEQAIDSLRSAITNYEEKLSDLKFDLDTFKNCVDESNKQIIERDNKIISFTLKLSEKENEIQSIYHSKSWHITRPFRSLAAGLRSVKNLLTTRTKSTEKKPIEKTNTNKAQNHTNANVINSTQPSGISNGLKTNHNRNDYSEWVRRYDTLTDAGRELMQRRIAGFKIKPCLSILLWADNDSVEQLTATIKSIRKQNYTNWKLYIATEKNLSDSLHRAIEQYTQIDSRIIVALQSKKGLTDEPVNGTQKQPDCEWVVLMNPEGILAEHALFWIADTINHDPQSDLIYSDEDKINEDGRRFEPHFKSDWNLDLFYAYNFISNLCVYRAEILKQLDNINLETIKLQIYDITLHYLEKFKQNKIRHIPRILYHSSLDAKTNAQPEQKEKHEETKHKQALNRHLAQKNINASVHSVRYGYRVQYGLPLVLPLVSLIIPTRNQCELLRQCVESILYRTAYPNYEILIVDNGSDDHTTLQYLQNLQTTEDKVTIIRDDRPFNYSALNNTAAKAAKGDLLGLINNDIEVISPDWLSEMVSQAVRPGVGAVGARLWYPNDTLQHGGVILGLGGRRLAAHSHRLMPRGRSGYFGRADLVQEYSAVTAACLVIKKATFEEVQGLNEVELQVAYNDVDFCLRLKENGYRNIWTPYADLYHHESASRGGDDSDEKKLRYNKEIAYFSNKWRDKLLIDPSYNSNLTLDHPDFSLAWPPRIEILSTDNTIEK